MPLPIFPLNTVLFPGIPLPLRVFENRYLRMLAERATLNPIFGISLIKSGQEIGGEPTYHPVGTTARLVSINAQGSSRVDIVVIGERRIRVGAGDWASGYAMADIQDIPDASYDQEMADGLIAIAQASYTRYLTGIAKIAGLDFAVPVLGVGAASASFEIASRLPLHTWEQQAILEDSDPVSRMKTVCTLLERELTLLYKGGTAGVPIQYPGERFTLN